MTLENTAVTGALIAVAGIAIYVITAAIRNNRKPPAEPRSVKGNIQETKELLTSEETLPTDDQVYVQCELFINEVERLQDEYVKELVRKPFTHELKVDNAAGGDFMTNCVGNEVNLNHVVTYGMDYGRPTAEFLREMLSGHSYLTKARTKVEIFLTTFRLTKDDVYSLKVPENLLKKIHGPQVHLMATLVNGEKVAFAGRLPYHVQDATLAAFATILKTRKSTTIEYLPPEDVNAGIADPSTPVVDNAR